MKLKITIFWDIMLHNLVQKYQCLGGIITTVSHVAGSFNPTSYTPNDGQLGQNM
jgi:hypothetical protein